MPFCGVPHCMKPVLAGPQSVLPLGLEYCMMRFASGET